MRLHTFRKDCIRAFVPAAASVFVLLYQPTAPAVEAPAYRAAEQERSQEVLKYLTLGTKISAAPSARNLGYFTIDIDAVNHTSRNFSKTMLYPLK